MRAPKYATAMARTITPRSENMKAKMYFIKSKARLFVLKEIKDLCRNSIIKMTSNINIEL